MGLTHRNYLEGKCLEAVVKPISVILNEVKDLELIEKTRFLASLRMTNFYNL